MASHDRSTSGFRRWCVLKANVLYRLATSSCDDVIDNFKLDVWAVRRWDSGTLHGRPFCCELIYDEFCSEFFSTDSEGELLIWLNRLERVTDGPAETTSAGLARRRTVAGSTHSLHGTFGTLLSIAYPICDKIWPNCAFYDTSMTFGTHLDFIITKIFGYIAISVSPLKALAAILENGRLKPIFSYLSNCFK
ncbi:hypothetical protein NP493_275g03000 [Ridgeia piscesae]|uniref:Uncharacterized protein n=1 Tax=Ridgeia piscesae TaxID=27915 RepID=A0AAD9NXH9_RIDPI|nr:hypothetical protein NP493_275g03000 [Ridgeia piscesae]